MGQHPQPGTLPAAFAIVRNDREQILLVRRVDDGYWELPGGRIQVGEFASTAAVREVAEETGSTITVTGLAGVYSDSGHVLAYPHGQASTRSLRCALTPTRPSHPHPDHDETSAAAWFGPEHTTQLTMHPAMRQRLTDALTQPCWTHFD